MTDRIAEIKAIADKDKDILLEALRNNPSEWPIYISIKERALADKAMAVIEDLQREVAELKASNFTDKYLEMRTNGKNQSLTNMNGALEGYVEKLEEENKKLKEKLEKAKDTISEIINYDADFAEDGFTDHVWNLKEKAKDIFDQLNN